MRFDWGLVASFEYCRGLLNQHEPTDLGNICTYDAGTIMGYISKQRIVGFSKNGGTGTPNDDFDTPRWRAQFAAPYVKIGPEAGDSAEITIDENS